MEECQGIAVCQKIYNIQNKTTTGKRMSFVDKFLSILSIVSGPPEKKMGIKASNTAEVRLFTDFYNTGRYCTHVLVEGIILLTQLISHFFKCFLLFVFLI